MVTPGFTDEMKMAKPAHPKVHRRVYPFLSHQNETSSWPRVSDPASMHQASPDLGTGTYRLTTGDQSGWRMEDSRRVLNNIGRSLAKTQDHSQMKEG